MGESDGIDNLIAPFGARYLVTPRIIELESQIEDVLTSFPLLAETVYTGQRGGVYVVLGKDNIIKNLQELDESAFYLSWASENVGLLVTDSKKLEAEISSEDFKCLYESQPIRQEKLLALGCALQRNLKGANNERFF